MCTIYGMFIKLLQESIWAHRLWFQHGPQKVTLFIIRVYFCWFYSQDLVNLSPEVTSSKPPHGVLKMLRCLQRGGGLEFPMFESNSM